MTGAADGNGVRLEMDLPAPISEVYAAWTEPEAMRRWLSPVGRAEVQADVRVGGRFRIVMGAGERNLQHTGEYLIVDPPHELSFTWHSPFTGDEPSVVTVTLTEQADHTRLVLVHERLPEGQAEPHLGGWGTMLERLAAEVLSPDRRRDATP
jgi:uncharacterized protein YndB with AHSA1/START domain